jgi:hypothetical protein
MILISFIEDEQLEKIILKHLDLWEVKRKPPPWPMWYIRLWRSPPLEAFIIYDQSSAPSTDDYLTDADYPIEIYL